MRTTLIFPPRSSPTYVPLGVSCLAADAKVAGTEVDLFDANLELWNAICDESFRLRSLRDFCHGPLERFLSAELYREKWSCLADAGIVFRRLETQAKAYLAGNGLEAELEKVLRRHAERIARNAPEWIGFSVMYLDQLPFVLAQARFLSENHSGGRIVLGGAAMSAFDPVPLLRAVAFLDAVFLGEGEIPLRKLLSGEPLNRLPGCIYRENGEVLGPTATQAVEDLSTLPEPDFSALAPAQYFNPVPVLPIYGCRGCRWRRCRFCTHNSSFGRFRVRPPELLAQEMAARTADIGCRHFYMVDQYVDPFSLNALCDAILAHQIDCRFQIMARTIGEYTPALLEKAARAGCCWISWGMESGSQRMLDLMNKGTTVADSERVIRTAASFGISNLLMMIYGAPGEDRQSMEETFSFLERTWDAIDGMTASAFVLFDQTVFGRNPAHYNLEVLGGNDILTLEDGTVLSDQKLRFRRTGETGHGESPLAAMMIDEWERRKIWLPPLPFRGRLCCEHYLIYADAECVGKRPSGNRPTDTFPSNDRRSA